jgi:hypothetical protein
VEEVMSIGYLFGRKERPIVLELEQYFPYNVVFESTMSVRKFDPECKDSRQRRCNMITTIGGQRHHLLGKSALKTECPTPV